MKACPATRIRVGKRNFHAGCTWSQHCICGRSRWQRWSANTESAQNKIRGRRKATLLSLFAKQQHAQSLEPVCGHLNARRFNANARTKGIFQTPIACLLAVTRDDATSNYVASRHDRGMPRIWGFLQKALRCHSFSLLPPPKRAEFFPRRPLLHCFLAFKSRAGMRAKNFSISPPPPALSPPLSREALERHPRGLNFLFCRGQETDAASARILARAERRRGQKKANFCRLWPCFFFARSLGLEWGFLARSIGNSGKE